ncbi:transposase IS3/IS911 family protein [Ruminiclostridium cellulolyticum H10]|uniref:Transposase IS3/IS911 family protein n=1 Tax=Ruminiclostridium cellulolyticum (strain ATCC 35319 / DSM 5812 / JCM 6584 / H10) TaxID=394503 RepID=B8I7E1_RUMCH|nr:transposase IS3/IS911 family protein [Ruminiclostridium cellulolyticum H10]
MKKRRTFTPEQKTKIVLEVLKEAQTLTEIAAKYEIQPNQLTRWKSEFIKNANRAFSDDADETEQLKQVHEAQIDELHRQIGQLTVERNWLKKKLNNSASRQSRQSMVDKKHKKLTITRQCQLLGLNRSTLYYQPHEPDRSEEYRIKWLMTEIAAKYEIQPNQLTRWKSEFIKNANRAFSVDADETEQLKQAHEAQIDELHRQIGQLTVERNWLKKNLNNSASRQSRQSMVDKKHKKLTITRQCQLLGLNRSTLYYQPHEPDRSEEYRIKWLIDEIYTRDSSLGYRRMTHILHRDHGININKKRTRRYMREMNIYGICPGPNLSKRGRLKYVHPYLLRGLTIDRPNQVWSVDITYCRMPKGHMYLAAIIDWHSKYIVGYKPSTFSDPRGPS